jgi:hypothetical protein
LSRVIGVDEGEKKAASANVMFIETSAKTGQNVRELFRQVASALPGINGSTERESLAENCNFLNFGNFKATASFSVQLLIKRILFIKS